MDQACNDVFKLSSGAARGENVLRLLEHVTKLKFYCTFSICYAITSLVSRILNLLFHTVQM